MEMYQRRKKENKREREGVKQCDKEQRVGGE